MTTGVECYSHLTTDTGRLWDEGYIGRFVCDTIFHRPCDCFVRKRFPCFGVIYSNIKNGNVGRKHICRQYAKKHTAGKMIPKILFLTKLSFLAFKFFCVQLSQISYHNTDYTLQHPYL